MRYPFFIARHYLFSRKRKTIINVISWISLIGLSVGVAALIVVLSVYNGIGNVTQHLFNVFDAELVIKPVASKTFHKQEIAYDAVVATPHVKMASEIVEENAWIAYGEHQAIVQLRGVDSSYRAISGLDTMLYDGIYLLRQPASQIGGNYRPPVDFLIIGGTIYSQLGITAASTKPIVVNIPKRSSAGVGLTLTDVFNTGYAYPSAQFYVQQDVDAKYVVANADFVRELMNYAPDEMTSLALQLDSPHNMRLVKKQLRQLLGPDYVVQDRFEQQPLYYKVYRSERLGIYLILSLIVLIATLNLVASLSLLIIDKQHDIGILRSMGMEPRDERRVFFLEGVMICAIGVVAGLMAGFATCLLQRQFGIVRMGSGNFLVEAFPVEIHAADFLISFLLVMGLSTASVWLTVRTHHRRRTSTE